MSETTSIKRTLIGRVVSDKMDKTVTVLSNLQVKHPMYGKVMVRSKKYHAHNDGNTAKAGDLVQIEETRPVSATKTWRVSASWKETSSSNERNPCMVGKRPV